MKRILVFFLAVAMLIGTAWGGQSVVGGNVVVNRQVSDIRQNFYLIDTNEPINIDGNLTTWEVFTKNCNPVRLVIYRKNNGAFNAVAESAIQTPQIGFNQFVLSPNIAVKAGDFVGLFYPGQGSVSFTYDPPNVSDFFNLTGRVLFSNAGGSATNFTGSSNRTYSLRVIGQQYSDLMSDHD